MLRNIGNEIERSGNHGALMQGYDYPALHLFLLPVFWRASISIHENLQHKELHYLHMKHLTVSTAGVKNLPV
jgi:hypothetical protein